MTTGAGTDRPKVLVVDDDPELLSMLSLRLSLRGYVVSTAEDGVVALEQARDEQPAVVVLDVMMPNMNGWEVARALRQDPATRDIKIVILTAIGSHVNEMTSPLYGVDAYVDKPFDFSQLESTIAALL